MHSIEFLIRTDAVETMPAVGHESAKSQRSHESSALRMELNLLKPAKRRKRCLLTVSDFSQNDGDTSITRR